MSDKMNERFACKNCVNFIEVDEYSDTVMCDYELWGSTPRSKAETFMPLDFECIYFEDIDSI